MTVFQNSMDNLDKEYGMESITQIWKTVGNNHSRRQVSRKAFEVGTKLQCDNVISQKKITTKKINFQELRGVILEVLTEACPLDKSQQDAWITLIDNVYSVVFEKLDK